MSPLGLIAGLSHMVVHAIMKISAFFCAGAVMHQTEKNYIYELDGLGFEMPVTFVALFISGLSLMGMPLFAGFVSKWNIVHALLEHESMLGYISVLVLLYSGLMTGIYMLTIIVRAWFPHVGYHKDLVEDFKDPNWLMKGTFDYLFHINCRDWLLCTAAARFHPENCCWHLLTGGTENDW